MLQIGDMVQVQSGEFHGYVGRVKEIQTSDNPGQQPLYNIGPYWTVESSLITRCFETQCEEKIAYQCDYCCACYCRKHMAPSLQVWIKGESHIVQYCLECIEKS